MLFDPGTRHVAVTGRGSGGIARGAEKDTCDSIVARARPARVQPLRMVRVVGRSTVIGP